MEHATRSRFPTAPSEEIRTPPPTLVDLSPGGAGVPLLLGVLGQQRVLVVVPHVGFRDGDGQNAAEVGELLLVEALDQAGQVGDSLQLDHLLKNTHTRRYPNGSPRFDCRDRDRLVIRFEGDLKDKSDLFDTEYVFDEGGSLQEGLLIGHQGEEKKNKVVPGCQALCHSLRLRLEIKIHIY